MGIRDEFHQSSILACIDELKSGSPIYDNDYTMLTYSKSSGTGASTSTANTTSSPNVIQNPGAPAAKQIHEMTQYSFSQLRKCDQCHKYLRGIIHQGMLCKKCGIVAHRTCARLGFQSMHCVPGNSTDSQISHTRQSSNSGSTNMSTNLSGSPTTLLPPPSLSHLSIFGTSLCNMFDVRESEAPEILQLCCSHIERQAKHTDIDLYRLYQSNLTSNEMVNLLRTKLNVELRAVNFTDYSLQCIVAVMKKFLRELPDPVIPVQFYDYFIQSSSKFYTFVIQIRIILHCFISFSLFFSLFF